jgi:hypothetical protein
MTASSFSIKDKIVNGWRELNGENDGLVIRELREQNSYVLARKARTVCNVINIACIFVTVAYLTYEIKNSVSH